MPGGFNLLDFGKQDLSDYMYKWHCTACGVSVKCNQPMKKGKKSTGNVFFLRGVGMKKFQHLHSTSLASSIAPPLT
jgi:hypothetical protein